MGRKLHKDDEFLEGMNYGMISILRRLKADIEELINTYEEKPIHCMVRECDGEGDSDDKIEKGIAEFFGYPADPLTSDDKAKIRSKYEC